MCVSEGSHSDAWVFVAPHPDDVALSCGALVAMLARTSPVTILTLFSATAARDDAAADSDFVAFQHARWGVDAGNVQAVRGAEDAAATAALGADVQLAHADLLDAIYRHSAYDSDAALFGDVLPEDADTVDAVATIFDRYPGRLVVPLAIGGHVDHQIALAAGRRLAARGRSVLAYADVPYVLDRDGSRLRDGLCVAGLAATPPHTWPLDDAAVVRGLDAIACYRTQLPVLFRDDLNWRPRVMSFLRVDTDGEAVARLWPLSPQ